MDNNQAKRKVIEDLSGNDQAKKSKVELILDNTLVKVLDEDGTIEECKALNVCLIYFLRANVKQLIQYIVEDAPEDADRQRTFKYPFVACEILTCEVDIILKALVEDEELMDLLFSFLDPERPHSTQLAGYFSKVVVCLLLRKTTPLMNYIQAHQDIIKRLVDLIGTTSIMEVLIRLIGADEQIYANYPDSMQWLGDMNVLEMIVDKFSSSDCPEVHGNAAETLCTITQYAPPRIASKISSPSFIGRLFRHALADSRPKSVLVNLLSVCISLLDPKRLTSRTNNLCSHQMTHGSGSAGNPETVQAVLESLVLRRSNILVYWVDDLLKLLDVSPEGRILLTTYGRLQPPLGQQRLKIIEFISVLVVVGSEVVEKELVHLGAVKRILELFFDYPFNNFLHNHVERIISSCLESKNPQFVMHLFHDCNLIGRILEAEKNFSLAVDTSKPTTAAEGRPPARIGNIGHITCIANKLVQLGNSNSEMQTFLQGNGDWVDWQANVLLKRNTVENVNQWACGRPTTLQDRTRDSVEVDYHDRDYDVAALPKNNLIQSFRYGIYCFDAMEETHGSPESDDEDDYFDDESSEVVISSLRLGDDEDRGSVFTNSNCFAFEDEKTGDEHSADPFTSSSPNSDPPNIVEEADNDVADAVEEPSLPNGEADNDVADAVEEPSLPNGEDWPWKRPQIVNNVDKIVRITNYQRVKTLRQIFERVQTLGHTVYDTFLSSCFGRFAHFCDRDALPAYCCVVALRALLSREIVPTVKDNAVWFRIGSKGVRFSLREYVLVTGLRSKSRRFFPKIKQLDLGMQFKMIFGIDALIQNPKFVLRICYHSSILVSPTGLHMMR